MEGRSRSSAPILSPGHDSPPIWTICCRAWRISVPPTMLEHAPTEVPFVIRKLIAFSSLSLIAGSLGAQQGLRPMTFLDVQNMRQTSGQEISPDGRLMVYAVGTPDWNQERRQSDLYVVSLDGGLATTRQLTFTNDKNETSPRWSRDGSFIAFLSDRDAATAGAGGRGGRGGAAAAAGGGGSNNQVFVMHINGGEAKRVSDARAGVTNFAFSKDGKSIIYSSGRPGDDQLYSIAVADVWSSDIP